MRYDRVVACAYGAVLGLIGQGAENLVVAARQAVFGWLGGVFAFTLVA